MVPFLVGLDVGTTASKAVVFAPDGQPLASGWARTPWVLTASGAELTAHALTASATEALGRAVSTAPEGAVLAVGVTSMAESGVLSDARGTPLGPVIAWHDTRDSADVSDLDSAIGREKFARHTGLPLRSQWSLTKHRWLRRHYPETKEAVRRLNVAEWVVRSLGGDEAAEQSLASRTGWLELDTRRWWSDTLAWSGASESLMPDVVTAGTPLGAVSADTGIGRLAGAVLTVAGHDHQAAAIGAGAFGAGDELDSCGTAEALVRTVPAGLASDSVAVLADAGITTGWHVLADRWSLLGATEGGLALQRVMSALGIGAADLPDLDEAALGRPSSAVTVAGVGTNAISVSGITSATQPADVWRAALDAVISEAWKVHSAMSEVAGRHQLLIVTGGWSDSRGFLSTKRAVFGPMQTRAVAQAGARGAALLAGLAGGLFAGAEEFPCLD